MPVEYSNLDLYFVGDVHGAWNQILFQIKQFDIKNAAFLFCGDVGIGFERLDHYRLTLPKINKQLKLRNIYWFWIRGNHDDPEYYKNCLIDFSNIRTVPDYTVLNISGINILCIGGGTSIDRKYRCHQDNKRIEKYMHYHKCTRECAENNVPFSYWANEHIIYEPKISEHIDVICTHSAPTFCHPVDKGDIVYQFAEYDDTLLEDIQKEREILDKVYNDYKDTITDWYYGHFHTSMFQVINSTKFRLLGIGEFIRHINDNDSV